MIFKAFWIALVISIGVSRTLFVVGVSALVSQSETVSEFGPVSVIVPPRLPKIFQGDHIVTSEGKRIELECISFGGIPPPEIIWTDGEGKIFTEVKEIVELLNVNFSSVRSTLTMIPMRQHHKTKVVCKAQSEANFEFNRTAEIELEVLYPPDVNLEITSSRTISGWIPEGSKVTLSCRANGNPSDVEIEWTVMGTLVRMNGSLTISSITRKLDGGVVKCRARNSEGDTVAYEILQVAYPPEIRSRPSSLKVHLGTTVTLFCNAEGQPKPYITWFYKSKNKGVGISPNLTLIIDDNSGGIYLCIASVEGFPSAKEEFGILIEGRPFIRSFENTTSAVLGKETSLKCEAVFIPPLARIMWNFQGINIDPNNKNYLIAEKVFPNRIESTLSIRTFESKHFGIYNCSIINAFGSDSAIIIIQDDTSNLVYPIVGGIGSVLTIIGISSAIIFYLKRYRKSHPPKAVNCILLPPLTAQTAKGTFETKTPELHTNSPTVKAVKFKTCGENLVCKGALPKIPNRKSLPKTMPKQQLELGLGRTKLRSKYGNDKSIEPKREIRRTRKIFIV